MRIYQGTGIGTYNTSSFQSQAVAWDDFMFGGAGTNTIGMGWVQANGGGSYLAAVAGHPGAYTMSTSAASSTVAGLSWSTNGAANILANDLFDATFIIRLNNNDTDTQVRIGFQGSSTGDPSTNGIYFEKPFATTSAWAAIAQAGGVRATSSSVGTLGTGWVRLRVRQAVAGTILFSQDGGAEVSVSGANVPGAVAVQAFVQIKNQVNASKTIDIDYFQVAIGGLAR